MDTPTGLAAVDGATWVVGSNIASPSVSLRRIDPQFERSSKDQDRQRRARRPGAATALGKALWIARPRLSHPAGLAGRHVVDEIDTNSGSTAVAVEAGSWVADSDGTVTLSIRRGWWTRRSRSAPVRRQSRSVQAASGWPTGRHRRSHRSEPGAVTTTIPVGKGSGRDRRQPGLRLGRKQRGGTVTHRPDWRRGERAIDVGESRRASSPRTGGSGCRPATDDRDRELGGTLRLWAGIEYMVASRTNTPRCFSPPPARCCSTARTSRLGQLPADT